jgi:microsomal dipeptidase-like Zn-dependent dipeptidase
MPIGYADLHCHPMSHLGFGGQRDGRGFFWGSPTEPIAQALPCCSPAHDLWKGNGILPAFTEHESPAFDGYDTFSSWPRHTSVIHQQMYLEAIHRAYRGGLRLMVASAVNNELLADLYWSNRVDSRDEPAIQRQLAAMRALAAQCSDWMNIVTSPEQAKATLEAGKLAVILAIEVDSIAGSEQRRDGQLSPEQAQAVVEQWWTAGVRLINPIHLVDNALGGTGIYDDRFNCSNHYLLSKWANDSPKPWFWEVEEASGAASDVEFLLSVNPSNNLLIQLYGQGYPSYVKTVSRKGHVNRRGLSDGGKAFLTAMMGKGMLIDVEHMSSHSLEDALTLAEPRGYPLVSSHTGLRSLAVKRTPGELFTPGCANEAMRSDVELQRLKALGSVLGVGGHVGTIAELSQDVSRGWAIAYRHATENLGFECLGIGTDMNGFATAPGPRFVRDDAQPTGVRAIDSSDPVRPIAYGRDFIPMVQQVLEQTALGAKSFNYNLDGLAHYGLLPDFTLDVALSLGGPETLRAFFSSADAVVEAWTTCVARSQP